MAIIFTTGTDINKVYLESPRGAANFAIADKINPMVGSKVLMTLYYKAKRTSDELGAALDAPCRNVVWAARIAPPPPPPGPK